MMGLLTRPPSRANTLRPSVMTGMRQTAIDFLTSKKVSLDGILTTPELPGQGPYATMLVCHQHPALGGNMEHPVVLSLCRAAHREGIASLRFNFRGIGGSEGTFSNGTAEGDDLRSALDILKYLPNVDASRIGVVGYSFGASVVLGWLRRCKAARSFVFIAPPLSSVRKSGIGKDKRSKLFVVGQEDKVVPSVDLQRTLDDVRPPVQFTELEGADHTLEPQLDRMATRVTEFLVQTLNSDPRDTAH